MRHAEAVEPGTAGVRDDASRPLTEKGRRQARRMGALLKRLEIEPDVVFTSALARAVETAKLVGEESGTRVRARVLDELAPEGDAEAIWQAVRRNSAEAVLIVGHLPSLAELAGLLLGRPSRAPLRFHKASLAALRCDLQDQKPHIVLEWMLSPSVTRRLLSQHQQDKERS